MAHHDLLNHLLSCSFSFLNNYHHPSLEIDFEKRKVNDELNDCLMSVDGTDFHILQKCAATKGNAFASHKYAGKPALRYELGICILTGHLVWIEGPSAAGKWNDMAIFNNCLAHFLDPNELVEADCGYRGHEDQRMLQCRRVCGLAMRHLMCS